MRKLLFLILVVTFNDFSIKADAQVADSTIKHFYIENSNQTLYNYLIDNGLTVKTEKVFYQKYYYDDSKPFNSKSDSYLIYSFFRDEKITNLGFKEFCNKYLRYNSPFSDEYLNQKINTSPKLPSSWKYILSQDANTFYYKADFKYDGGDYVKVWMKTLCKTYARNKITYRDAYYIELIEFDLKNEEYNNVSFSLYNKNGKIISTKDYSYSDWNYIVPDSILEGIFNKIKQDCEKRLTF